VQGVRYSGSMRSSARCLLVQVGQAGCASTRQPGQFLKSPMHHQWGFLGLLNCGLLQGCAAGHADRCNPTPPPLHTCIIHPSFPSHTLPWRLDPYPSPNPNSNPDPNISPAHLHRTPNPNISPAHLHRTPNPNISPAHLHRTPKARA